MLIRGKGGGISPGNAAQGLFHWAVGSGAPPRAPPHLEGGSEAGVRRPGWNHSGHL